VGADPVLATITGTANQITSTAGAGSITLSLPSPVTLPGNLIIPDAGYIGSASDTSAIQIAANGEVTFSDVATGILPTTGSHLATKEYVDLAVGASFDFFVSDTASGVGSNYLMYPIETGEAESTVNSSALGQGDDQLCFAWLSEAGNPGTSTVREGIYDVHLHLNRAVGNKSVDIYWTLSFVDADGSSNETLLITSETVSGIDTTETGYDIHGNLANETPTGDTKRLLFKVFANVGATGTNAVVTSTMEGTHDAHISVQLPSSVWQHQGDVLDDLNTLGTVASDGQIIVGTGAGAFAYESGATARTSLGLAIGTNVQAWDASLDSIAALTYASDSFIKVTAEDTYAIRTIAEVKTDLSLNNVENTAHSTDAHTMTIDGVDVSVHAALNIHDAVADTTDTSCWVGLFESATGDLAPKTDGGLTYNAGTAALTATTFIGALTGQADTVATIAGLAPDTATTQATQANITTCANLTTVGTIGTGVWNAGAVI
jgi:hypothetical protein